MYPTPTWNQINLENVMSSGLRGFLLQYPLISIWGFFFFILDEEKLCRSFLPLSPIQKGITLHSSLVIKIHKRVTTTSSGAFLCQHSVWPLLLQTQLQDVCSITKIVKYCSQNASSLNCAYFIYFLYIYIFLYIFNIFSYCSKSF